MNALSQSVELACPYFLFVVVVHCSINSSVSTAWNENCEGGLNVPMSLLGSRPFEVIKIPNEDTFFLRCSLNVELLTAIVEVLNTAKKSVSQVRLEEKKPMPTCDSYVPG